ncbi:MAG: phosphotransferase [Dyadobacter sp.]|uniref:phosphotransferase enzyme family protein n=1 Tax=Dyadobacter sp. TaxID=1914288 RepID=UPI00326394CE
MDHFPVTNSNLSATHLAQFLKEKYFSGTDVSCRLLKAGINDTYLVTCPYDQFVYRVYSFNWRTTEAITEELRLLRHLHENGVSVSYPIQDKNGADIHYFNAPEGTRPAVLFSYAPGDKVLNYSPEMHYNVGTLMARMHAATLNFPLNRVTYTSQELLIDSLEQLKRFLANDTEEMAYMKSTQAYLVSEFQKADTSQLRKGAVHLDLWFDNINITKDGEVTLFDFDFCGNGWLCLDMAYYILQIHSTEKDEAERSLKLSRFMAGYESVTKVPDEEKRIIPMLGVSLYFFYLGIQSQRYENWSNVFFNDVYLKRFINLLLKKYFDFHQLGQEQTL